MDEESSGAASDDETSPPAAGAGDDGTAGVNDLGLEDETSAGTDEASHAAEIIDLPWDDDLPVALGEDTRPEVAASGGEADDDGDREGPDSSEWEHEYEFDEGEHAQRYFARREAERRADTWRTRSATGAIATAIAMGLQQVFEPEKRRPAAVAEAPSDPYSDEDPVTVEYVPDDAEATTVRVKPWLLQKGDPT